MLSATEHGLWCAAGGFHVDPCRPVDRAVITHAHSDHARGGCGSYLCALPGVEVLRRRLGAKALIQGLPYGEVLDVGGVRVSLHPAGHVLGSAQIRLERGGEVWVVSGDYKTEPDPTCAAFEPVRCHLFITESTFGLPIYRWPSPPSVFEEIAAWWGANRGMGRTSVLLGYSLGKAQRLLAGLGPLAETEGPVLLHSAVEEFLPAYVAAGVRFPKVQTLSAARVDAAAGRALVIGPPGGSPPGWLAELGDTATGLASGWMLVRATRRGRGCRGFVLSDHADWPGLVTAIRATGAERILVTHGAAGPLVRWLNENGWSAQHLAQGLDRAEGASIPGAPRP